MLRKFRNKVNMGSVSREGHSYFLSHRVGTKSSASKYCTTGTVEMLTRRFSASLRKISSGLFDYWVCVPRKTLFVLVELNQADDNAKCISTRNLKIPCKKVFFLQNLHFRLYAQIINETLNKTVSIIGISNKF